MNWFILKIKYIWHRIKRKGFVKQRKICNSHDDPNFCKGNGNRNSTCEMLQVYSTARV